MSLNDWTVAGLILLAFALGVMSREREEASSCLAAVVFTFVSIIILTVRITIALQ